VNQKRIWAVSALDLVFLVLGSVLLVAQGFERGLDHLHLRLPEGPGIDGRLACDARAVMVAIDADGLSVDGIAIAPDGLETAARAARDRGADEAIVAASREIAVARLVPVLGVLRQVGFEFVRIPLVEEHPK
jgi:biopolymer transport protein ExbD